MLVPAPMAPRIQTPQRDVTAVTTRGIKPESDTGAEEFTQPTILAEGTDLNLTVPIENRENNEKYLGFSNSPYKASRSGASSFINDYGDATQLDTANSSRFATSAEPSISSDREDDSVDFELAPKSQASSRPRVADDDSNNTDSLLQKLRAAKVKTTENDGSYFFPLDKLDELINRDAISKELQNLNIHSRNQRRKISARIWKGPSPKHKTTRRKIFAVLTQMGKAEAILDFIEEKIYDSKLPFKFSGNLVTCNNTDEPIQLFGNELKWQPHEKDIFEKYQWELMTPYFKLSCEEEKNVGRMPLEDRIALPFTEANNIETEGGFSMVLKVKIHKAHYNAHNFVSPGEKAPYFAVKTLKFNEKLNVLGNQEVQSLIRLNNENHPNLIKLLITFQHKDRLHLVFPWADGNLQDFWKKQYPNPHQIARDSNLARWMVKQCLGLALGLKAIHHNCVDKLQAKEQGLSSDASQKKHGRHGDFKPENILWFKQNGTSTPDSVMGVLKVSDFGFADFHASLSKSDVPSSKTGGMTPTYRAPEWDVMERVSPAYDIWCFGCVLLEFVEWYLRGWNGIKDFEEKRIEDSKHVLAHYREDNFFNSTTVGQIVRGAVAKKSVRLEIQELRHHTQCSDFILDLLQFIEYQLLRMQPQKRASCDSVVNQLQEIWKKCEAEPTYCTERQQSIPKKRNTDLSCLEKPTHPPERSNLSETPPATNPPLDYASIPPVGPIIVCNESNTHPNLLSVPKTVPPSQHSDNTLDDSAANSKNRSEENAAADNDVNLTTGTRGEIEQTRDTNIGERTNKDSQKHVKGKLEKYVKRPFRKLLCGGKP